MQGIGIAGVVVDDLTEDGGGLEEVASLVVAEDGAHGVEGSVLTGGWGRGVQFAFRLA